ncbi:MAG: alpha/beta hydrolase [Chitinophagaceae bacterium]
MEKKQLLNKTFEEIVYYKTGSGPAILLVHGFPANAELWRFVVPALAEKYTVILPDFFGKEKIWLKDNETSTLLLAESFNDILAHEKLEKILYIGHSMGGYMGLEFASRYPEKLAGLSLVHSSPLPDDEARAEGRRKTVAILQQGGKRLFLKKMVPALFAPAFLESNPEIVDRQLNESVQVNDESLAAFYKAIMERRETTATTKNAGFPVQTIIGKKDSISNITKELAGEILANINFVRVYENTGHMAMLENSRELNVDLLEFAAYCWSRNKA